MKERKKEKKNKSNKYFYITISNMCVCVYLAKPKCQQHLVFPGGHPSKY